MKKPNSGEVFRSEIMLTHFAIGIELKRIKQAIEALDISHQIMGRKIYGNRIPQRPVGT